MTIVPTDSVRAFNTTAKKRGWSCLCDGSLAFMRPELAAVAGLWLDRAGTRAMPARADLDARSMKPYLSDMTLLEQVVSGRYRLRIHGTTLTQHAGDHTGRFVEDMIPPHLVDGYNGLYDFVLTEARPMRVMWDYQVPIISYLKGESFVAPLTARDGSASLLLSVTYTEVKARRSAMAG